MAGGARAARPADSFYVRISPCLFDPQIHHLTTGQVSHTLNTTQQPHEDAFVSIWRDTWHSAAPPVADSAACQPPRHGPLCRAFPSTPQRLAALWPFPGCYTVGRERRSHPPAGNVYRLAAGNGRGDQRPTCRRADRPVPKAAPARGFVMSLPATPWTSTPPSPRLTGSWPTPTRRSSHPGRSQKTADRPPGHP